MSQGARVVVPVFLLHLLIPKGTRKKAFSTNSFLGSVALAVTGNGHTVPGAKHPRQFARS